jgi:hypothetical protein
MTGAVKLNPLVVVRDVASSGSPLQQVLDHPSFFIKSVAQSN